MSPVAQDPGHLSGELEWLESAAPARTAIPPAEDAPEAEAPQGARVSRILYCPRCEWMESEAAERCFRCGAEMLHDIAHDPTLRRLGITRQQIVVHRPAAEAVSLTPSPALDAASYLDRIAVERLRLLQGFDELASLDHIALDHYDYQLDATRTVLSRMRGRALLADEVGLGKTIEAGLIMKEFLVRRLVQRVLILTPASLVFQWQEELATKFREPFEVITTSAQWDAGAAAADDARLIISLDRAKGELHARHLLERPWDLVVIDEAHRLRNRSTQAYKFVKALERRYMLMLTATPVHNDLTELYSLIDLLKPGQLGTIRSFREQFVKSGDPRSPENAPALKQLLGDVMIRNRRSEVGVVFPARRAAVMHIDLPPEERSLYDDVSSFIRRALHDQSAEKQRHLRLGLMTIQRELCSSPAAVASTLRKMASDDGYSPALRADLARFVEQADAIGYAAKVDAVLDLIEQYPGKFLIFTEFRRTQDDLLAALAESGVSAVAFHGGLSGRDKEAAVRAFRDDAQVLVSTESGGEGRNLQFCHQLINYDLPWNPMRVEQRIGRVHRLGQQHDVHVFNLSTRNTLEAYLLELLVRKIRMFELVVGELDLILGDVDKLGESRSFEDMIVNAWMSAEDEIDLQVSFDAIGDQFDSARKRYLDTRVLNEEVFDIIETD